MQIIRRNKYMFCNIFCEKRGAIAGAPRTLTQQLYAHALSCLYFKSSTNKFIYKSASNPTSSQNTRLRRCHIPMAMPRMARDGNPTTNSHAKVATPAIDADHACIGFWKSSLNAGVAATKNVPAVIRNARNVHGSGVNSIMG